MITVLRYDLNRPTEQYNIARNSNNQIYYIKQKAHSPAYMARRWALNTESQSGKEIGKAAGSIEI